MRGLIKSLTLSVSNSRLILVLDLVNATKNLYPFYQPSFHYYIIMLKIKFFFFFFLASMVPLRTFDIHGHIPMHKRFFIVKKFLNIFKTLITQKWFLNCLLDLWKKHCCGTPFWNPYFSMSVLLVKISKQQ